MFCSQCGKELPENSKFCSGCGRKVEIHLSSVGIKEGRNISNVDEIIPEYFTETEDELRIKLGNIYIPMMRKNGMMESLVNNVFNNIFKHSVEESINKKTNNLPKNYGNILIARSESENEIKMWKAKLEADGVTVNDIKEFWNMHDYERRLIIQLDVFIRTSKIFGECESYMDTNEVRMVTEKLKKTYQFYGDSHMDCDNNNNDRPLPYELKFRIDQYFEKHPIDNFINDIEKYSTCNSYLREEIKKGII